MTHDTAATSDLAALRRALLLDAGASGAMGVLLLVAPGPLAPLLGLPAGFLQRAGVVLVPFAAFLTLVARRARVAPGAVRTIVGANVLWVLGSVALLLSGWVSPTRLGILFVLAQAATVAAFAYLEYGGLRRATASALRSATAAVRRAAMPNDSPGLGRLGASDARFGQDHAR